MAADPGAGGGEGLGRGGGGGREKYSISLKGTILLPISRAVCLRPGLTTSGTPLVCTGSSWLALSSQGSVCLLRAALPRGGPGPGDLGTTGMLGAAHLPGGPP